MPSSSSIPHQHSHSCSRRGRSRSPSISRSRSRSRASNTSSLDVEEMLLQATTTTTVGGAPGEMERRSSGTGSDGGGFQHHRPRSNRMRPISPSSDILYSQRSQRLPSFSGEGGGSAPQLNSGQQQTYQTHIFAPPVTGAPVKKSKFMPTSVGSVPPGTGNGNGSAGGGVTPLGQSFSTVCLLPFYLSSVSVLASNGSSANVAATPSQPYPAQNTRGQGICRHCGQPGRCKDGKCVEKWGAGPQGPGTVCDR
jgi:hypothetical protein